MARLEALHARGENTQEWPGVGSRPIGFSGMDHGRCFIRLDEVGTFVFDDGTGPVEVFADRGAESDWIEDSYRRLVLPLVIQVRGTQVLHASAVEAPPGIILLCGFSGAGKSSLAFGLGRSGYRVWADDALAFESEGPSSMAHPLPFRIRLLPDAADYFMAAREGGGGKVTLPEHEGDRPSGSRPIAAGFLLDGARGEVGAQGRVQAAPISSTETFRRILPHGYFFHAVEDSAATRRVVEAYLELAARVPFFRLARGEGRGGVAERIDAVVRQIESSPDED